MKNDPELRAGCLFFIIAAVLVILALSGAFDSGEPCHPEAVDCGETQYP